MGQAHALLWKPPAQPPRFATPAALTIEQLDALLERARAAELRLDLAEAERLYNRVRENTDPNPGPMLKHAHFLINCGRLGEGASLAEIALKCIPREDPSLAPMMAWARRELGLAALGLGHYGPEAWAFFDLRFDSAGTYHVKEPWPAEWKGEPLAGKSLLVLHDQGLGDDIQFARLIPRLVKQGIRVSLQSKPALVRTFAFLGAEIIPEGPGIIGRRWDRWTYMPDLPDRMSLTFENLPSAPYLPVPKASTPTGARIGVLTRGNPNHANDGNRSLRPADAQALLAIPGALDLHVDNTGAKDFHETAAIIAGLDLVISVDSAVAHLAGAMGKPVWIMLPAHGTDWRWMRDRTDSPWYPSATLYRQERPGDWATVIDRVKRDVTATETA